MQCTDQAPEAEFGVEGANRDPVAAPVESPYEVDPALALPALIARVCTAQRIREAELRSGSRCRPVSLARATIAYLALHDLGVSLAETARLARRFTAGAVGASRGREPGGVATPAMTVATT